ncbi:MAG: hypothetical protein WB710_18460, partial [Stellaceae bacterium]
MFTAAGLAAIAERGVPGVSSVADAGAGLISGSAICCGVATPEGSEAAGCGAELLMPAPTGAG